MILESLCKDYLFKSWYDVVFKINICFFYGIRCQELFSSKRHTAVDILHPLLGDSGSRLAVIYCSLVSVHVLWYVCRAIHDQLVSSLVIYNSAENSHLCRQETITFCSVIPLHKFICMHFMLYSLGEGGHISCWSLFQWSYFTCHLCTVLLHFSILESNLDILEHRCIYIYFGCAIYQV